MSAVIYSRYSSDLQKDTSIDDQVAYCRTWANRNGLIVIGRYEDRAISGSRYHDRLGLMRLLRDAKDGLFKTVIVEHSDRLSRHPADIHTLREALNFSGVTIMQVNGGEFNALQASVSGLVSSIFLEGLKDKIRRGMTGRVAQGLHAGGRAYGYRAVKGETGKLEIVIEQAAVVRRIFADYLAGQTPREIAGRLNSEMIAPPRGTKWNASTINGSNKRGNGILGNELYCGALVWNKVHMVRHPETRRRLSRPNPKELWQRQSLPELAIVSADIFEAVQSRRSGRTHATFTRRPKHLLSGLLRCPDCGKGMSVKGRDGNTTRIQCSTWAESKSCTNNHTYSLNRIEKAVVAEVLAYIDNDLMLLVYISTYNDERKRLITEDASNRDSDTAALRKATAELERAINLVVTGVVAAETMHGKMIALQADKKRLETTLASAAQFNPVMLNSVAASRYRQQLAALRLSSGFPDETSKSALRDMISTVTVYHRYKIEISGTLSPLLGGVLVAGERSNTSPLPFVLRVAA